MIRKLFSKGPTTRADVIFAIAGALVAGYKAIDTINKYKADHATNNEENQ